MKFKKFFLLLLPSGSSSMVFYKFFLYFLQYFILNISNYFKISFSINFYTYNLKTIYYHMSSNSSPFIERLLQILNDPFNSEIIQFDPENGRIEIFSKKNFENILSRYFRHRRFQSFVRQLNWYGFYKVNSKKNICYGHPDLEKGFKLQSIKSRRTVGQEKNTRTNIDSIGINNQEKQNKIQIENKQKSLEKRLIDLPTNQQTFSHRNKQMESPLNLSYNFPTVLPSCQFFYFYI